jgi:methyl-accepting chemotaxis protein WspA
MTRFSQWKLALKLAVLVSVSLLGSAVFGLVTYGTLDMVKVNGSLYRDIIRGKDLIADVLPPPEYIIESYLALHQLEKSKDKAEIDALVERGKRLRHEYDERHEHWMRELREDDALKRALVEASYEPALRFFETRDAEFLPALAANDRPRLEALLAGPLKQHYEEHRRAIDRVVALATRAHLEHEGLAVEVVSRKSWLLLSVALGIVFTNVWLAMLITRNLTRRILLGVEAAKLVASGDLTTKIDTGGEDETGALLLAIKSMTASLSSLIARVKQASVTLMSTATEISATSKQQDSTMTGFTASTAEIAAAAKEISATSQELLATMTDVSTVAGTSAALAASGHAGLAEMDTTMRQLSASTGSISGKLSAISDKANDINLVVTTITKVADQTNLLSVNAAIEAEKAGEYGLGFLVVAREIRRLADQSAVSTLEIEHMVRHMQTAVSAGVMEMDKFTQEVRRGVGVVAEVGGQLSQIIDQVQGLSARIERVNDGMRSQSHGAAQISEAMSTLTDGARQTAASIKEFNGATLGLREAVGTLKQEISFFKLA